MTDAPAPPLKFTWDGEAMSPASAYWAKLADRHYVVGEIYTLAEHHDRSIAAHNRFFAGVHEAWMNLPEHLQDRFPSETILRKWALIKAGYCDIRTYALDDMEKATRIAADGYSIVDVRDNVLTIYTAQSQSVKAMGKAKFYESVERVDAILAELIGVSVDELRRNEAA